MAFVPSRRAPVSSGPFVCTDPDCRKSFLRKEHLNRHMAIHTNSRRHECCICGRSFARSDSLNRHVLQHSISPTKRTPSACQTCRRRKTKCDSNYPCSTCADGGESCVREPSSRQAFTPVTRSSREGSHRKRKTPIDAEELDPTGAWNLTMPSAEDTSPIQVSHMQLDWNPLINRSASNSIANTRPALRDMCAEDPLQPLIDPLVAVMSGINTTTSTPSENPLYYGRPSDIVSFPFEAPVWQPSELRDYVGTDQSEVYMSNVPTYNPADFQQTQLPQYLG